MSALKLTNAMLFLSTLSLRRATNSTNTNLPGHCDFYPRSPCGERPFEKFEGVMATKISIHALLAESDHSIERSFAMNPKFLSTLSLRRATDMAVSYSKGIKISIHALLAESDSKSAQNSGALLRI